MPYSPTPDSDVGMNARALPRKLQRESHQNKSADFWFGIFVLIFIFLTVGILLLGYQSYQNYAHQFRTEVEKQLATITQLKAAQLHNWRAERLADARVWGENRVFVALLQTLLEQPENSQARAQIQSTFDALRVAYDYDRIAWIDTQGVEQIASPPINEPIAAHILADEQKILNSGEQILVDFHRDTADGEIYLGVLMPMYTETDHRPLGLLLFRVDPRTYLYPYLQNHRYKAQAQKRYSFGVRIRSLSF